MNAREQIAHVENSDWRGMVESYTEKAADLDAVVAERIVMLGLALHLPYSVSALEWEDLLGGY